MVDDRENSEEQPAKDDKKKVVSPRSFGGSSGENNRYRLVSNGVGPSTTLAWPGCKQPDIPVEVDTERLETCRLKNGWFYKMCITVLP